MPDTISNNGHIVLYNMSYTMGECVPGEFDTVVEQTTDDLADEGFDILCDIDVQRTLQEKL